MTRYELKIKCVLIVQTLGFISNGGLDMSFIKHWHWTSLIIGLIICLGFFVFTQLNTSERSKNSNNAAIGVPITETDGSSVGRGSSTNTDSVDPWETWVHNQSHIIATVSEKNSDGDSTYDESYQDSVNRLTAIAAELKKIQDEPPPVDTNPEIEVSTFQAEKYDGPQTIEGLTEAFGDLNDFAAGPDVEAEYPGEAWIQRILDIGGTITTRIELTGYFNSRQFLFQAYHDTNFMEMLAHSHGFPTDSWEVFEDAFINHSIWEKQTITNADEDPTIDGGVIIGYNFYPTYMNKKTVYVEQRPTGATTFGDDISDTDLFDLIFRGVEPEGFEVIYLDSEWDQLAQKPPPITKEEFIEANFDRWLTSIEHEESEWVPPMPRISEDFDSLFETLPEHKSDSMDVRAEAAANAAKYELEKRRKYFEQTLKEAERLSTLTDAELEAEFEKMLLSEILQVPIPEQYDANFREGLTPESIAEALSLLNQHGSEDGLQQLQKMNPAMAAFLSRRISRQGPPVRKEPLPRPRRD